MNDLAHIFANRGLRHVLFSFTDLFGVQRAKLVPASAVAALAEGGAGFAGLYAATLLAGKGARPQVFEAGDRVGGRVWSLRGVFPGQVAERGAELIDTTPVVMRSRIVSTYRRRCSRASVVCSMRRRELASSTAIVLNASVSDPNSSSLCGSIR